MPEVQASKLIEKGTNESSNVCLTDLMLDANMRLYPGTVVMVTATSGYRAAELPTQTPSASALNSLRNRREVSVGQSATTPNMGIWRRRSLLQ
jgi:hypothetical protein